MTPSHGCIGIVVIGRNEGQRLQACLASLPRNCAAVYVDSNSSDGSAALARAAGFAVIELDIDRPLSAARARNSGIRHLWEANCAPRYIQTVDGDCELIAGWLSAAAAFLDESPSSGVVTGVLRERDSKRSVFHRLSDDEWQAPVGEISECGGIAMWRCGALKEAGLFDESFGAGEEPELGYRIREKGWTITRLPVPMGMHDSGPIGWKHWGQRMVRSGYAIAQLSRCHSGSAARTWHRERMRILAWTLAPIAAAPVLALIHPVFLLSPALAWGLFVARMTERRVRGDAPAGWALVASVFNLVGKFPQLVGVVRYELERRRPGGRVYRYEKRIG